MNRPIFPHLIILEGGRVEAWDAGFNANSNLFRIKIFRGIDHFAAVLAHERNHVWFMWTRFLISAFMSRELELRGKAVEIVVARDWYSADVAMKLDEEVRSLMTYKQFKGWSIERCKAELLRRIPTAEHWCSKRTKQIQSDFERGNANAPR